MGAAFDRVSYVQRDIAGADAPAQIGEARSPREIIAACEYELRQMRRQMQAKPVERAGPGTIPPAPEPFVPGARLRNEVYRASLAADCPRGSAKPSAVE